MSVVVATAVEAILKHMKYSVRMCKYLLMNVVLSDSWIALQQTQRDSLSLTLEGSCYKSLSTLCWLGS